MFPPTLLAPVKYKPLKSVRPLDRGGPAAAMTSVATLRDQQQVVVVLTIPMKYALIVFLTG
jgi:hypothetical protein